MVAQVILHSQEGVTHMKRIMLGLFDPQSTKHANEMGPQVYQMMQQLEDNLQVMVQIRSKCESIESSLRATYSICNIRLTRPRSLS